VGLGGYVVEEEFEVEIDDEVCKAGLDRAKCSRV
jgi:hypothetical protein